MKKYVAYYDNIYLVALNEEKTSEHRVTERDDKGRPGTIRFFGNSPLGDGEMTYGTLVLNAKKWKEWFGRRKKLPGFETHERAAETLVSNYPSINYGCPLCTFQTKSREEHDAHIFEHINKFISQFRIEEVEDDETE